MQKTGTHVYSLTIEQKLQKALKREKAITFRYIERFKLKVFNIKLKMRQTIHGLEVPATRLSPLLPGAARFRRDHGA